MVDAVKTNAIKSIIFNGKTSNRIVETDNVSRVGSRTAATSKMERFVIIVNGVNYYHKTLHLGCCISPRSDSG